MRHKRAAYYGGRSPVGFWIAKTFIAALALASGWLVVMIRF
jgi:hypothetical protein